MAYVNRTQMQAIIKPSGIKCVQELYLCQTIKVRQQNGDGDVE